MLYKDKKINFKVLVNKIISIINSAPYLACLLLLLMRKIVTNSIRKAVM
jgi:hypothetical protein